MLDQESASLRFVVDKKGGDWTIAGCFGIDPENANGGKERSGVYRSPCVCCGVWGGRWSLFVIDSLSLVSALV